MLATCSTLVKLQFEGGSEASDAAFGALAALGTFNRPNKLVALQELVRRLIDGEAKVLLMIPSVPNNNNWTQCPIKLAAPFELVHRLIDGMGKAGHTAVPGTHKKPMRRQHRTCEASLFRCSNCNCDTTVCFVHCWNAKTFTDDTLGGNKMSPCTLQAGPAVETLLDGMDFQDDVAVVLDQALGPLLSTLDTGAAKVRRTRIFTAIPKTRPTSVFC